MELTQKKCIKCG